MMINGLNPRAKLALCILGLLFALNTVPAWAMEPGQRNIISRAEAVKVAKQGRDIKVLKVDKKRTNSGVVYRIKLLTKNGRVKKVGVDAFTGAIVY